jgi:hypothetical protein
VTGGESPPNPALPERDGATAGLQMDGALCSLDVDGADHPFRDRDMSEGRVRRRSDEAIARACLGKRGRSVVIAPTWTASASRRYSEPNLASQMRTAFSQPCFRLSTCEVAAALRMSSGPRCRSKAYRKTLASWRR